MDDGRCTETVFREEVEVAVLPQHATVIIEGNDAAVGEHCENALAVGDRCRRSVGILPPLHQRLLIEDVLVP